MGTGRPLVRTNLSFGKVWRLVVVAATSLDDFIHHKLERGPNLDARGKGKISPTPLDDLDQLVDVSCKNATHHSHHPHLSLQIT
jgi:hypothetical protein